MSIADYFGVVLAFVVGTASLIFRNRLATVAVRQHERLYGARWDPRSFRFCFGFGGIFVIAWGLFVLVGGLIWGG